MSLSACRIGMSSGFMYPFPSSNAKPVHVTPLYLGRTNLPHRLRDIARSTQFPILVKLSVMMFLHHRTCPKGVDPYPWAEGESEEQLIDCYCPGECSGSLLLGYRGHTTHPIPYDASAELVKYRLEVCSKKYATIGVTVRVRKRPWHSQ